MFISFPSGSYINVLPPEDGRLNLLSSGGTASATVAMAPDERLALHHLAQAAAICPGVSARLELAGAGSISLTRGPNHASVTVTDEEQVAADVCGVLHVQELANATAPIDD